jgi:hypothetical protein
VVIGINYFDILRFSIRQSAVYPKNRIANIQEQNFSTLELSNFRTSRPAASQLDKSEGCLYFKFKDKERLILLWHFCITDDGFELAC